MQPLCWPHLRAGWADRMLQTDFLRPDAMPIRLEQALFLLMHCSRLRYPNRNSLPSQEITLKCSGIQTKALARGFTNNDSAHYEGLKALLKDLDIATLMNDVWKSPDTPIPFLETSGKEMEAIMTINVNSTLQVTHIVAPATAPQLIGVLLTRGSLAGFLPTPISPI